MSMIDSKAVNNYFSESKEIIKGQNKLQKA